MYEQFGPIVDHAAGSVQFKLFFPDNSKDLLQYGRGGLPKIKEIRIPGTFNDSGWDQTQAPIMNQEEHPSGILYTHTVTNLADGFYEYKFYVTFEKKNDDDDENETRWVNDPCTRYSAHTGGSDNSGFVVGGNRLDSVTAITNPASPQDLIIYEMMIDDFTENLSVEDKPQKNKFDIVRENISYLQDLGVTALQPLPWTTVPGTGFNWGYEPFLFFSVDERLTHREAIQPQQNVDRLYSLKLNTRA